MTLNDLEPKIRRFNNFLAIFSRVKCDEMTGDKARQPTYKIVSIKL